MLPALTSLVDRLLPEELWQHVQLLLPAPPPRPRGGVPRRVPDRNCVAGLVFMARTSTPWALLPARELGCGSATTCWRRFDEWARAGMFEQLQGTAAGRAGRGRVQAAPGWRRRRAAAIGDPERRQRQRRHHVRGRAGRHPTNPHAQRAVAPAAWQGPWRQGV